MTHRLTQTTGDYKQNIHWNKIKKDGAGIPLSWSDIPETLKIIIVNEPITEFIHSGILSCAYLVILTTINFDYYLHI